MQDKKKEKEKEEEANYDLSLISRGGVRNFYLGGQVAALIYIKTILTYIYIYIYTHVFLLYIHTFLFDKLYIYTYQTITKRTYIK